MHVKEFKLQRIDVFLFSILRYWTMDRSLQRRLQKTNYQHIKRLCRDRGQLFEDPDFPPNNRSIYRNKKPPLHPIVWLRPHVSSCSTFSDLLNHHLSAEKIYKMVFHIAFKIRKYFKGKFSLYPIVRILSRMVIRFPHSQFFSKVPRQLKSLICMRNIKYVK